MENRKSWEKKRIPHASRPKIQNMKQKQYCNKFNKSEHRGLWQHESNLSVLGFNFLKNSPYQKKSCKKKNKKTQRTNFKNKNRQKHRREKKRKRTHTKVK